MNKNIYTAVLLLALSSCSSYTLHTGTEHQKSITDIPLVAHHHNVDIYFNNDRPAQPYYKVKVIEVTGLFDASYDDLLNLLKLQAAAAGLDGVLILEKKQNVQYTNTSEPGIIRDTTISIQRQEANIYQSISAIGLKYVGNIGYMDTIVKSTMIDVYEDGKARKLMVLFDYYGNLKTTTDSYAARFYADYVLPFDILKHDAAGVANWEYSYDELNRVISFRISEMEEVVATAIMERSSSGRINTVRYKIKDPVSKKTSGMRCNAATIRQISWLEKICTAKINCCGVRK